MRLTVIGGTGGYPGRGEPCSGYLVEADGYSILIDPGYGVAMALTVDNAPPIDAVLVSHAHPDHCADLNPILRARAWAEAELPPLPIHAPAAALDAVMGLDRAEVVAGAHTLHVLSPGDELDLGPFAVRTATLPHPRPNLGMRLAAGERTLVYTGDCGPSDELVALAAGADLLLAEASYAEAVPPEIVGMLSSAAEVGAEAAAAGVARLVLTHLMPRTDPVEAVAAAARTFTGPIVVARPGVAVDV